MPSTLTRVSDPVSKIGAPDITFPPKGIVASFTGTRGDLVKMTSGAIDAAAAVGATIASSVEAAILNQTVASGAATGSVVGIEKASQEVIWQLPIADSSGGTLSAPGAIATPTTTIPGLVGAKRGISRATGGTYYVDNAITSAALLVEIVGPGDLWPLGDAYPAVYCKPVTTYTMA